MSRYRLLVGAMLLTGITGRALGMSVGSVGAPPESAPAFTFQHNDSKFDGPEQAHLVLGMVMFVVRRSDLRTMQATLLQRLKESSLADRDARIRDLQSAVAWIDKDENARIGDWRLEARQRVGLLLVLPISRGQARDSYVARVERLESGWKIGEVELEHAPTRK